MLQYDEELRLGAGAGVLDDPGMNLFRPRPLSLGAKPSAAPRATVPGRAALADNGTGLALGQRVDHKKFGEGVVLDFEGRGPQARVQVNFRQAGTKWLVVQLANLRAL